MRATKTQIQQICIDYLAGIENKELAVKYNLHRSSVQRILKRNGIGLRLQNTTSRKYFYDETFFSQIDTQNKAYILGMIAADGTVSRRNAVEICLQEDDKELLEKIAPFFGNPKLGYRASRKRTPLSHASKPQYRLCVTSKRIALDLRRLGIMENKSLKIRFPNLPTSMIPHFIRGFFDGDGCLCLTKRWGNNAVTIVSNPEMCSDMSKQITKFLNINASVRNKTKTVKVVGINGNRQIEKFLDWIYFNAEIFMQRKFKKYQILKHKLTGT